MSVVLLGFTDFSFSLIVHRLGSKVLHGGHFMKNREKFIGNYRKSTIFAFVDVGE